MFIVRIESTGGDAEVYYTHERPRPAKIGSDTPAVWFRANNGDEPGGIMTVAVARVISIVERVGRG